MHAAVCVSLLKFSGYPKILLCETSLKFNRIQNLNGLSHSKTICMTQNNNYNNNNNMLLHTQH